MVEGIVVTTSGSSGDGKPRVSTARLQLLLLKCSSNLRCMRVRCQLRSSMHWEKSERSNPANPMLPCHHASGGIEVEKHRDNQTEDSATLCAIVCIKGIRQHDQFVARGAGCGPRVRASRVSEKQQQQQQHNSLKNKATKINTRTTTCKTQRATRCDGPATD